MLRNCILYLYVTICGLWSLSAQEPDLGIQINALKNEIQNTQGVDKLKLLDSLSRITRYKTEFNYDSIVKSTIAFATQLDSLSLASSHVADHIFYLANRAEKPIKAIEVFDDFRKKEWKNIGSDILAQLYINGADGYFFSGQTQASIEFYEKAGAHASLAKNYRLLGKSKNYMSDAYADTGHFAEASQKLEEAELIFDDISDTVSLMTTRNSRANLYSRIGFFEEAKQIRIELIALAKERDDYRMLQSTYYNMAIDDRKNDLRLDRIENLKQALYYAELGNYESYQMRILISLLHAYAANDNLILASQTLKKIEEHPISPNDGGLISYHYLESLANYEFAQGNNTKAIDMGLDLLDLESANDFGNGLQTHEFLSKAYREARNTEKSYFHYKLYTAIKDSIIRRENVNSLTYYQTLYETKKRDATIENQEAQITILDIRNEIKAQWMLFGGIGLLALFIIFYLFRRQQFIKKRQTMQEQFSHELLNQQEKERTRLSRELHDSVGQKLMLLTKSGKKIENSEVEDLASSTLEEVRHISRGLYPPNLKSLGLTMAINTLIHDINTSTDLFFTDEIENIDLLLSKDSKLHLFRIIQETLSNIVKHSEAKAVKISVTKSTDDITVFISDNGKGFNVESAAVKRSLGMKTVFERAKILGAHLNLTSKLNKGTSMTINIPINNG